LIGFLSILTLSLRGSLPEKTYLKLEIPSSEFRVAVVTHGPQVSIGWKVQDFSQDFDKWYKDDRNAISLFFVEDKILHIKTVFNESMKPQYVRIYRKLNLELLEHPIFRINISVSEGAIYHIRFKGIDSSGAQREVWWESSPLDDIPGRSTWEIHSVDLRSFSEQATGELIPIIDFVEIILDNPHLHNSMGEKTLKISYIEFAYENIEIKYNQGNFTFYGENPFHEIIIKIPLKYEFNAPWDIKWISVTYILTSDSRFEYEMFMLSRDGAFSQKAKGSIFLSHKESFIDIYRLDASPEGTSPRSERLTFVMPMIDTASIAIVKRGFDPGGFLSFELHSIEIMLSKEPSCPIYLNGQMIPILLLMLSALTVVPISLMAYIFSSRFESATTMKKLIPLIYGVGIRLIISPFTGHPYDMEVWTQATRMFYESGVVDLRTFPLPLTYYILLLSYSPYALLKILGFQDAVFISHRFGMVEAIFIKAPFIFSDVLSLYFLLNILKELIGENQKGKFALALMYFLNPLAITLSAAWGMYDGIAVSLFLAGIYYSMLMGKAFLGSLFYILSGLTKAFGFLGLLPLVITLLKERKISKSLSIFLVASFLSILFYLPLLKITGFSAIPEIFLQFLRGRMGLGSNPPYIQSSSYMFYLSLLGLRIYPPHLTYLLIALLTIPITHLVFDIKTERNQLELILKYFIISFFILYLTFFRVYEQYYLWVIPILIIYSYDKENSWMKYTSLSISIFSFPILLLSVLLTGVEYYWLPVNLPSDAAIMAVLPSTQILIALIGILIPKGSKILKTPRGWIASTTLASWFSVSLAYHAYYGKPPLGGAWYLISLLIAPAATYLLYKEFKNEGKYK
jgi:hypothetical protein